MEVIEERDGAVTDVSGWGHYADEADVAGGS